MCSVKGVSQSLTRTLRHSFETLIKADGEDIQKRQEPVMSNSDFRQLG